MIIDSRKIIRCHFDLPQTIIGYKSPRPNFLISIAKKICGRIQCIIYTHFHAINQLDRICQVIPFINNPYRILCGLCCINHIIDGVGGI